MPCEKLLFVGHAASHQLHALGLYTIGDIAKCPEDLLKKKLGRHGDTLCSFARGDESSQAMREEEQGEAKSISNSTTPAQDMSSMDEAKPVLYSLADSVTSRLRSQNLFCQTVSVWMRDTELNSITRQTRLRSPSNISDEIVDTAMALLAENWDWHLLLRSLEVQAGALMPSNGESQIPLFTDSLFSKKRKLDQTLDRIRNAHGHAGILRGLLVAADPSFFL